MADPGLAAGPESRCGPESRVSRWGPATHRHVSTRTPAGGCTWAPRHTRSRRSNGFVAGHAMEDCTASEGQKPLSRRCSLGARTTGSIRLARTRTLGSALPCQVVTAVNLPIDRSIRRLVAPHGETQTQFHHASSRRADASPERVHTAPNAETRTATRGTHGRRGSRPGAQTLGDSFSLFPKLPQDSRGQDGGALPGERDHGGRWEDGFCECSIPSLVGREGMPSLGVLCGSVYL